MRAVVERPPGCGAVGDQVLVRDAAVGRARRYRHIEEVITRIAVRSGVIAGRRRARYVDIDRAGRSAARAIAEVFILNVVVHLRTLVGVQLAIVNEDGRHIHINVAIGAHAVILHTAAQHHSGIYRVETLGRTAGVYYIIIIRILDLVVVFI